MPALNPKRSRPALRIVTETERAPASSMPVTVKLPEGFRDDVVSILAAARELERVASTYATPEGLKRAVLALVRLERTAVTARERLG